MHHGTRFFLIPFILLWLSNASAITTTYGDTMTATMNFTPANASNTPTTIIVASTNTTMTSTAILEWLILLPLLLTTTMANAAVFLYCS